MNDNIKKNFSYNKYLNTSYRMNNQTKTLITVAAVLLLIYFLYNRSHTSQPKQVVNAPHAESVNVTTEDGNNKLPENMENVSGEDKVSRDTESGNTEHSSPIPKEDMVKYFPNKDYAPPESDWLKQKFTGRDKGERGFKRSSYSGAARGDLGPSSWQAYFDDNNNVFSNSQTGDNDKFLPIDETNGGLAVFKSKGRASCGSNQNCQPEDLFDVDKYLPQEVNDDWFETTPEPISIKNRHLINITKPIGINTIGSSLRNSSWDIRGAPSCPRYVVSPWLQSSIEPDQNLKPLL